MGAVFMAEQEQPVQRRVALKIIKAGMDSAHVLARFEAERQALAMMDHPNIARVLDAGATDAGRPYFVMELVKGIPITRFCDQEHLTPRERLDLFIPICHAVQHAHQKGIIHRDLKPSNLLIALYDGKPVPKVIDFGVAKATAQKLTERTMFTEVGQIVGTLEYMAPEQAELNNLDIDTRADIYSLGVLLYELLTGSPGFTAKQLRSAAFAEMLRIIREVEPAKPSTKLSSSEQLPTIAANRKLEPRKLMKLVTGELDWIVMKCLEKERGRRYETANGLGSDLERYLADEPVLAGPPSAGYRLRKFVRRNRGPVLAAGLLIASLVVGIIGTAWGLVRAEQVRKAESERAEGERLARLDAQAAADREREAKADEAKARSDEAAARSVAEKREEEARFNQYGAQMNLVQRDYEANNLARVRELLDAQVPREPGATDFRNFEWYYWQRLSHRELLTLQGHTGSINHVAYSPDGRFLASAGGGGVGLWDSSTGQGLLTLKGSTSGAYALAFSPNGRRLASSDDDRTGTVRVWDVTNGQQLLELKGRTTTLKVSRQVSSLAFNPDGRRLAAAITGVGGTERGVRVWDAESGQELPANYGQTGGYGVVFSPDGRRLATVPDMRVWDAESGQPLLRIQTPLLLGNGERFGLAYSPDSRRLVTGCRDGTVRVYDAASGQELLVLKGHTGSVTGVAYSLDGRRIASAGDGTVRVWDAATGDELLALKGHVNRVFDVAFSPDGRQLASGGVDPTVRIWDAASARDLLVLKTHENLRGLVFSPDGRRLAGLAGNKVRVWDAASGQRLLSLTGFQGLAFSPDSRRLASASLEDGTVRVRDAASGQELLALKGHTGRVRTVAFSSTGRCLASAGDDATVRVWDAADGRELLVLKGHTGIVHGVAFRPDGQRLASLSADGTARI
jgi:WD40 repeat protein/tRNA A-37 threonylcarbamoyl transferase component Bud32